MATPIPTAPSPSNDNAPPPQQGPPTDPPPAPPPLLTPPPALPSAPPPAPPAPPVPVLPPPSPQKPSPPPAVPTPEPPSSSPPPPTTTPASSPPPPAPSAPSIPSPTVPTPASPATPATPLPSWSPPPPASSTPSPPPPASVKPSPPSPAGRSPSDGRSTPSSSPSSSNSATTLIAVLGSLAAALVIIGLIFVCCWKKRRRGSGYPPAMNPEHGKDYVARNAAYSHPPLASGNIPTDSSGSESYPHAYPGVGFNISRNSFMFEHLNQATNGFSEANLLGQGGFGYVHKGVLPSGEEVAIKQMKAGSGQGEREFQAEVEIISRVHHKHLVSLVGYCIMGAHRLLVYEFLPNDTLHYHLHGKGGEAMDWQKRLRIALGSAKGLAYLHEDCYPKIIHRDVKAANILLDFRFEAKVADFGLAKFCSDVNTHVSTRVMGTFGYLAPEYASTGKLTEKSDVYSFGVVLLELITGRKPLNSTGNANESLVDWAKPYLTQAVEDENFDTLVDPRLQDDYDPQEMLRMVACAATSVRYSAKYRPKMCQIVRALEGNMSVAELMEGTKAAGSSMGGSQESLSSEYNTGQYNNDLSRIRQLAFASQSYEISEAQPPPSTSTDTSTPGMAKGRQ